MENLKYLKTVYLPKARKKENQTNGHGKKDQEKRTERDIEKKKEGKGTNIQFRLKEEVDRGEAERPGGRPDRRKLTNQKERGHFRTEVFAPFRERANVRRKKKKEEETPEERNGYGCD